MQPITNREAFLSTAEDLESKAGELVEAIKANHIPADLYYKICGLVELTRDLHNVYFHRCCKPPDESP